MTLRIDLKASFLSSLESRGVPRSQHGEYEFVLYEVVEHMGDKPASRWSAIDLEEFLSARTNELNIEQRSMYGTALAVISELLDKADRKGASLSLEQTDFIAETLRRQVLDDPRVKKSINKIRARPAAPRRAKRVNREEPVPATRPPASKPPPSKPSPSKPSSRPASLSSKPGLGSLADSVEEAPKSADESADDDFSSARGARTSIRTKALDDSGFGRQRRRNRPPSMTPPPVPDDGDRDAFDPEELGIPASPAIETEEEAGPGVMELLDLGPSVHESEVVVGADDLSLINLDESDSGVKESDSKQSSPQPVGAPHSDDQQSTGIEGGGTVDPATEEGARSPARSAPEAVNVDLTGWLTNLAMKRTSDGSILLDNLYSVRRLPDPADYALREAPPQQGGLHEFVESNRLALIALIAMLLISTAGFVISEILGAILLVLTLIGTGVFTWLAYVAGSFDSRPSEAETPESAVLEYVAALRMGLAHRARNFLAVPADVEPIPIKQLMERHRSELGRRFNVVGPAALRAFWKENVDQFDREEGHPLLRLTRRLLKPAEVDVREIMRRDDEQAAVCVVGGRTMDEYAAAPVIKMGDAWMVAEGEFRMRSARVESLGRLARLHTVGKMDDDGLVDACRRENLTRADVTKARLAGVLTEGQAMLLAGRNVRSDVL